MQQVVPASAAWRARTDLRRTPTMAPQVVEDAVLRLRWVSLTCAILIVLLGYMEGRLQPETAKLLREPVLPLVWLFVILLALGINVVRHLRLLSPLVILNLGLVFEVVVAAAISLSETALPLQASHPVLGAPKVALWIAVVGLLIPNRPWVRLVTALVSASTWPLAYVLNLHLQGYDPLPANRLVMWIYLPYLTAFVNYAISKRISRMETAVQRARDLGSYQLVSLIGRGGMGEVWRARHRMLARDAAIKVIRADLMILHPGYESEITRKRFEREARAIASLQSPHTVYLFDFGVSEDGSFYYVMELLDGISLQILVEKFGPQPASRVIHMLRQVCESLEEAHRQGLIHRDIKPTNIFACKVGIEYDFMKVLDFGLVKNVSRNETLHLTATGVTAGTPAYMAPEVAMGEEHIDGRVDIYALGCVAYYLLTGAPVFDEKSATAMAMAHVQKPPTPPSQRSEVPVPAQLDEIVLRCLAKKPEQRPQSAQDLSRLLASISDVREWSQESASEWWHTYLPALCSYRTACQPHAAASDSSQQRAQPGDRCIAR
ncbi:MAG: serine/threonine-protein kinase [Bryobacteraceae bacterium]